MIYQKLNVVEFKIRDNQITVWWDDNRGNIKSVSSIDLPHDEFKEAIRKLVQPFAYHLGLPAERIGIRGVKYSAKDDGRVFYTISGCIYSRPSGINNSINCTLEYDTAVKDDNPRFWNNDDAEKIGTALLWAGYYAQGCRKSEEPELFDDEVYEECDDGENGLIGEDFPYEEPI